MAKAAGIDVPETRLIEDRDGRVHFLIRRFDRSNGLKTHFQSFSGLTHTRPGDGLEYGELMNLARTLCSSEKAAEEFFLRAVFNVAAGNEDDHGRNHGFLMDASGEWRPSPAYDITFATHPLATNLRSASVMGKFSAVTRSELTELGKDQGVRRIDDTIDRILTSIRRWPEFATAAGIPDHHAALLADDVTDNPLVPHAGSLAVRPVEVSEQRLADLAVPDDRARWWVDRLERVVAAAA